MAVIDVNGFKQGMAAILERHNLSGVEAAEEGETVVRLNGDLLLVQYLSLLTCHPDELLQDVVEYKPFDTRKVMYDIIGLFKYFGVIEIKGSDGYFFMGYDDGGSFVFENVMIMGEGQNENNSIQQ